MITSIFYQNIRRQHHWLTNCVLALLVAGLFSAGCAASLRGDVSAADEKKSFTPRPKPPGFDPQKARMSLSEIPDSPPAPEPVSEQADEQYPPQAQRHLQEAERLFAEQQFVETVGELENVLRHDADNPEALRLAALVRLLAGDHMLARFFATQALSAMPADPPAHYVLARVAEQEGEIDKAFRRYRQALKCPSEKQDAPYRALAHVHLGYLLQQKGYYRAAAMQLQAYRRIVRQLGDKVERNPELAAITEAQNESIVFQLASSYEVLDRYGRAAEVLKSLADQKPENYQVNTALVRLLMLADRKEEAAERARAFVENTNGNRRAVKLLLAVYRDQERLSDGLQVIENIVAEQPDNIELGLVYADALQNVGRQDKAVEHVRQLIENYPNAQEARWKLIALYRLNEQWDDWVATLISETADHPERDKLNKELNELSPDVTSPLVERIEKGDWSPQDLSARSASVRDYVLGRLSMRLDRLDKAETFFKQARRRTENFALPVFGQVNLLMQRCRWSRAIRLIQDFQQRQQEPVPELLGMSARCYQGLDRYQQAVNAYQRALELRPDDAETRMDLARLYERMGVPQRARAQYEKLISLNPDYMEAREALVQSWLMQLKDSSDQDQLAKVRKQLLSQLEQMQKRAPYAPATLRSKAMLKLLLRGVRDQKVFIETLRKLVENFPEDLRTRRMLTGILFAAGDYQAARVQAEQILQQEPHCSQANEMLAMVMVRTLQFEKAMEQLGRMLQCYPNRFPWIRTLANLRLLDRDYDGAAELWKRMISLAEEPKQRGLYRQQLIRVYRLAGEYGRARKVASEWLQETGDLMPRHQLLLIDLEAEDYEQYLKRCRGWLRENPDSTQLRNWLLLGLQEAGEKYEATLTAIRWLADDPADAVILQWIMRALQSVEKFDQAIEIARSQVAGAGKKEPRIEHLKILAELYLLAGEYDQALDTARTLIAMGEQSYREQLGIILVQAGRFEKAIAHYERLLSQAAEDTAKAGILRRMAMVRQEQNRADLALRHLREAHELAPNNVGINNDLGYTLAEAGEDLDRAERMIRTALGQDFLQPAYLDSMGWIQYKKGRFAAARKWLRRASALEGGEDPVIYEHMGDARWRLGEAKAAQAAWERALEIQNRLQEEGALVADEGLTERINEKLKAATGGGEPAVAPIAGEGEK